MKLKALIPKDELKGRLPHENHDIEICTARVDKASRGALLFLLPGIKHDTYELIPQYLKSTPYAIVTENTARFPKSKTPLIEVKNARRAFAYASSKICGIDYSRFKLIGITGTNGKTTTATIIKRIFEGAGKRCGFIGTGKIEVAGISIANKYYSMTSPDPDVLYPALKIMQDAGCEYVIMETSSHALALDKLAPLSFDIGIFTGLSHEHLEFHKSMENYFESKEKLIRKSDKAIINYDDMYGRRLYEKYESKSFGVGLIMRSDINITDIENHGLGGCRYTYRANDFSTRVTLPLPGVHNIQNSSYAFLCAYLCGLAPAKIKKALEECISIDGRCECIEADITVIIDYAHTPKAFENIFKTAIYGKKAEQKITAVFGCGGERDTEKRALMAEVAEKYADRIIVTNDNPRSEAPEDIILDIIKGFKKKSYAVICDRECAITYAVKTARTSDIVIIAGKGHEKYILDKKGYHDFDERSIINNALNLRKSL